MATAEQIKALLRSHADRDDRRFYAAALQVAAQEARQGHHKLASDIKQMVEKSQSASGPGLAIARPTPLTNQPRGDLKGLLDLTHTPARFAELVLSDEVQERLNRVLLEQRQKDRLAKRPVQKLPRGAVYFLGKLLTLGIRTTEVQGWKRQSLTTNCGY
ncbi:hypothetical protein [Burkholderia glumae]